MMQSQSYSLTFDATGRQESGGSHRLQRILPAQVYLSADCEYIKVKRISSACSWTRRAMRSIRLSLIKAWKYVVIVVICMIVHYVRTAFKQLKSQGKKIMWLTHASSTLFNTLHTSYLKYTMLLKALMSLSSQRRKVPHPCLQMKEALSVQSCRNPPSPLSYTRRLFDP